MLAGDGSGGGLAFSVLQRGAQRQARRCRRLRGDVALGGPVAVGLVGACRTRRATASLNWDLLFVSARHYLKKTNPCDPYASPAFASFKDFPPIMVHAGSLEMLRDDASRLGDRAADAGVPVSVEIYDGMQHVFQASDVPEAKVSLQRLGQFIRTRTAARQNAA